MALFSLTITLLSNLVTLRRDKSILFSRVALILLYSNILVYDNLYSYFF